MGTRLNEFKYGLKFIILNRFINSIPCWTIRRLLYRIFRVKISRGAHIGIGTIIQGAHALVLGRNAIVNEYCWIDARGGLTIGANSSISSHSAIITGTHSISSGTFQYESAKVEIKENVWLGYGAVVLGESVIEEGAVIGAGCVFKGVAESGSVYVGNPASKIKERELESKYDIVFRPFFR